jgi:hypothetical protein
MMRADEMAHVTGVASRADAWAGSLRLIDSGSRRGSPQLPIEQSIPARSGGVDRLAQLARLIEQDATLAAIVRGTRSEHRVELSPSREKTPSHAAREDKSFEHRWQSEAGLASVHPDSSEAPIGETPDPREYGESDGPDYSNGLPDPRRGLKVFAALIGLALAGSATAVAYWELSDARGRSHEVRMKAASSSPDKTAPSPAEHSRSGERPRDPPDERSVNATGRTIAGAEEPADAKPSTPQTLPPMDIVIGPAPTKIAGLIPAPTPSGSPASIVKSQPPEVKKPAPRRRAPRAAASRGAHDVRYDVQLSSERSESAARLRSLVLQSTYPAAFAGREPFIRRADLGDRGVYYRVQMGPFAIEEANQICGDLKKAGADCVLHRN